MIAPLMSSRAKLAIVPYGTYSNGYSTLSTREAESQGQMPTEFSVHGLHVGLRHGAEFPIDHRALDGPEDPRHQRGEEQSGSLPVGNRMVTEDTGSDVAADGRHDDFLPPAVVAGGTEDQGWADLLSGFVGEHEPD